MMEGRIAGLTAAERIHGKIPELINLRDQVSAELAQLRDGPFGKKVRMGNQKLEEEA